MKKQDRSYARIRGRLRDSVRPIWVRQRRARSRQPAAAKALIAFGNGRSGKASADPLIVSLNHHIVCELRDDFRQKELGEQTVLLDGRNSPRLLSVHDPSLELLHGRRAALKPHVVIEPLKEFTGSGQQIRVLLAEHAIGPQ